jgi:Bifunctional DNA primase/polymerase, N-terminal
LVITPTLADHAIELATAGWRILPCVPSGPHAKAPLTDHGHLDASTDLEQIRDWWNRWPDAMIGAAVASTRIVIDFDPRTNPDCLVELERLVGRLPATLTAHSGRCDGGRHLYYLRPAGALTSTRLPAGIDLKVNGYTIVPPSPHPATGKPYTWEIHPVVLLPCALRKLLRPAPLRPVLISGHSHLAKTNGLVHTVLDATAGNRNRALFWAACRAAENDVLDMIESELFEAAVSVGLSELEARRTIDSAQRVT